MRSDNFIFRRLTGQELNTYHETGYCFYGPILTADGLQEMHKQCMHAWEAEKRAFDSSKTWLENALVDKVHHIAPIVRDYYFEGPLVNVAEQIIGPNVKAATCQLTFKMKGNSKPFPWHQDNGYGELDPYNAISCLTALDDTNQENGCLWLIPGSNLQKQLIHQRNLGELKINTNESKAIPMPMKAGTCLFFNCWTLHKSDGNHSQSDRRILFLRYADADAVEVHNNRAPRLGKLLLGTSKFSEVLRFEAKL